MDFEEANKKVHPVETQWHYPIMTKYGYTAITKEAVGFVRSYKYVNPEGHEIVAITGYNADGWEDTQTRKGGYWSELAPYLADKYGKR